MNTKIPKSPVGTPAKRKAQKQSVQKTKKSKKTKKRDKGERFGRPKKKSASQRQDAAKRAAELSAIGWVEDRQKRRTADSCFQRRYIKSDLLAKEGALHATKWVGYQYMTPLQATELFGREYIATFRRVCARHFDPKNAHNRQPIKANLGENSVAEMNSLWTARQYADERGIPYDVFLDILMDGRIADKWEQPPLPCQLLSGTHTAARLRQRPTRDEVTDRLFQPHWDRRFYGGAAVDDAVRAAALRELRIDVLRADDRPQRLAKYLGIRGLLSESDARVLFDGPLVDAALSLSPAVHRSLPIAVADDQKPACIGNRNVGNAACKTCPVTMDCMRMKAAVTRALIKTTGSADPRLARKRELDRERQQKCRTKKKAILEAASNPVVSRVP